MISNQTDILVEGDHLSTLSLYLYNEMAKIVFDDWREEDFNQEDYISKEELEKNYVPLEKYEKKKEQAKNAFANTEKAKQEALAQETDAIASRIREEVTFTTKHGFESIPDEIKAVREQHPTLSWEQAYQISWYEVPASTSTNPWREDTADVAKTEYTFDELADLAYKNPKAYDEVAQKIESGEFKQI